MNPITHFLIGWAVANSAPSLDKRERMLVIVASVVPGVDGLGVVFDWATRGSTHPLTLWGEFHHVLGHGLRFALLYSALAALWAKQRLKTTILAFRFV